MSQFMIWSRVEAMPDGRFVAIASAIPCNSAERCAPEERCLPCENRAIAEAAAAKLAHALSHDIHARGGHVAGEREGNPRAPAY
ncbi:MAG: hypothetical protein ACXWG1_04585 [Usitatibacter sp.]